MIGDVDEFLDFMPHQVTLTSWVSESASGMPKFDDTNPRTYQARIELKNHLIVNGLGMEILARGQVFLATKVVPSVKDKLLLPPEYVPRNPPILDAYPVNDEAGIHHITLEIG